MKKKKDRPVDKTRIIEELTILDAQGRLGGKGKLVRCPRCGYNYVTSGKHFGSDWCLIQTTLRKERENGFTMVPRNYQKILDNAGIENHNNWGGMDHPSTKSITHLYGKWPYKGVVAGERMFAPTWVLRALHITQGIRPRGRRIAVLRAIRDLPELQSVILTDRFYYKPWPPTSDCTIERWIRTAIKGVPTEEVPTKLKAAVCAADLEKELKALYDRIKQEEAVEHPRIQKV